LRVAARAVARALTAARGERESAAKEQGCRRQAKKKFVSSGDGHLGCDGVPNSSLAKYTSQLGFSRSFEKQQKKGRAEGKKSYLLSFGLAARRVVALPPAFATRQGTWASKQLFA